MAFRPAGKATTKQKIIEALEEVEFPKTPRQAILDEASEYVHKDRNADYGSPEDNFRQIADLWTAYKGTMFSAADIAIMCMLIKVARLAKTPTHHDSCVDIAGYAACLGDVQFGMRNLHDGVGAATQGYYEENAKMTPQAFAEQMQQAQNNINERTLRRK